MAITVVPPSAQRGPMDFATQTTPMATQIAGLYSLEKERDQQQKLARLQMAYDTNNAQAIQEAYRDLYGHDIQLPGFAGKEKIDALVKGKMDAMNAPVSREQGLALAGQAGLRTMDGMFKEDYSQDAINDAIRRGHAGEMYQRTPIAGSGMVPGGDVEIRADSAGNPMYTEGAEAAATRAWHDAVALETPGKSSSPAGQNLASVTNWTDEHTKQFNALSPERQQQLVNQQVPGAERMTGLQERSPYETELAATRMLTGAGVSGANPLAGLGLDDKKMEKLTHQMGLPWYQKTDEKSMRTKKAWLKNTFGMDDAAAQQVASMTKQQVEEGAPGVGTGTDMYGEMMAAQQLQENADSMSFGKGYEQDLGAAYEAFKRRQIGPDELLLNAHRVATYYNEDPRNAMALFTQFGQDKQGGAGAPDVNNYQVSGSKTTLQMTQEQVNALGEARRKNPDKASYVEYVVDHNLIPASALAGAGNLTETQLAEELYNRSLTKTRDAGYGDQQKLSASAIKATGNKELSDMTGAERSTFMQHMPIGYNLVEATVKGVFKDSNEYFVQGPNGQFYDRSMSPVSENQQSWLKRNLPLIKTVGKGLARTYGYQ